MNNNFTNTAAHLNCRSDDRYVGLVDPNLKGGDEVKIEM